MTHTQSHDPTLATQAAVGLPQPSVVPTISPVDASTGGRLESALDQLQALSDLLQPADDYQVPPLDYDLPAGFLASIVIPVFNEETTIREVLARVSALPIPKQIIAVDDFSTDNTRHVLQSLEGTRELQVVLKDKNEGKGAALRTGFAHATGDVVIVQDADLEYDPRDIPRVLRPIVQGESDVVYGSRFLGDTPQDPSWLHRFGNGLLTRLSNLLTGYRLTDMETCYKAFRREALLDITIKQNRFGVEPEMTAKLARRGRRIQEVPISYDGRSYEEGKKIGLRDAFNALYCIARYRLAD